MELYLLKGKEIPSTHDIALSKAKHAEEVCIDVKREFGQQIGDIDLFCIVRNRFYKNDGISVAFISKESLSTYFRDPKWLEKPEIVVEQCKRVAEAYFSLSVAYGKLYAMEYRMKDIEVPSDLRKWEEATFDDFERK